MEHNILTLQKVTNILIREGHHNAISISKIKINIVS